MEHEGKSTILKRLKEYKVTEFQMTVLKATMKIPREETRTYKQIAIQIGHPKAYRAVGSALGKNPLPIIIPCHRVIKSSGELGNYSGIGGIKKKMQLLKKEKMVKATK